MDSGTTSDVPNSEMPVTEALTEDEGESSQPAPPTFPPYPPYIVEPAPPSVADTIIAGHGLRLQHKALVKKPLRPPPKPARPRGPKATDVKLSKHAMRAHERCLRRHGAILTDRLERMSKPLRRNIIYLWREYAHRFPPETIARLRAMLDADEPFKPDQAYEYFVNLKKTKKNQKAAARVNEIKKDVLSMVGEKKFVWARNATVAFARGIQQRLSRPGRYALADRMLRLSDIVLQDMCNHMHMKTPSRRSLNPKARFMMEMSDKVAVWIDEILNESDERMLMMDFDEDEDVLKQREAGDASFTDDFLDMMGGGGPGDHGFGRGGRPQLLPKDDRPAYMKFKGDQLEAFKLLTDAMDKKGLENLLKRGTFEENYKEGSDELKKAQHLGPSDYTTTLVNDVNKKLTETTKGVTPTKLAPVMKDMVDNASHYLAQNAEQSKVKGPEYRSLVKAMREKPNEELYKRNNVIKMMPDGANQLEQARDLTDVDHDDANLTGSINDRLVKLVTKVVPTGITEQMHITIQICSKYLSQKAVDDAERGPGFDFVVNELEKRGGEPFLEKYQPVKSKQAAAYALRTAPGLTSIPPDPATAPEIKAALHKAVDPYTTKEMKKPVSDAIERGGNYLSGYVQHREEAMDKLLNVMKSKPQKAFFKNDDYTMDYEKGVQELQNAPEVIPLLPVKDIADKGKEQLAKDVEKVTPEELKVPMKTLVNDVSKYLSQPAALRSGAAGEGYPMKLFAAANKSVGARPLYKTEAYGQTYAEAGEELNTASHIPDKIELSDSDARLKKEITTDMNKVLPKRLGPTITEDLKPSMNKATDYLAHHGNIKGKAAEEITHYLKEKADDHLVNAQGYDQSYDDAVKRIENAPTLQNEKVSKPAYDEVKKKITAMAAAHGGAIKDAEVAQEMDDMIDKSAKFLSAPPPETNAEQKQVLADLMVRKGDEILHGKDLYNVTYQQGAEEVKDAPLGKTTASDKEKKKEIVNKLHDVIPDEKMKTVLKEAVHEGAAHIADVVEGRGQAMGAIRDALKGKKDEEFIDVGSFKKTHEEVADIVTNTPTFNKKARPSTVLDEVSSKLRDVPVVIPDDKPLAKQHLAGATDLAAKAIATAAANESGLTPEQLKEREAKRRAAAGADDDEFDATGKRRRKGGGAGGVGEDEEEAAARKRRADEEEAAARRRRAGGVGEDEEEAAARKRRADEEEAAARRRRAGGVGEDEEEAAARKRRADEEEAAARRRRAGGVGEDEEEAAARKRRADEEEAAARKRRAGGVGEDEEEAAARKRREEAAAAAARAGGRAGAGATVGVGPDGVPLSSVGVGPGGIPGATVGVGPDGAPGTTVGVGPGGVTGTTVGVGPDGVQGAAVGVGPGGTTGVRGVGVGGVGGVGAGVDVGVGGRYGVRGAGAGMGEGIFGMENEEQRKRRLAEAEAHRKFEEAERKRLGDAEYFRRLAEKRAAMGGDFGKYQGAALGSDYDPEHEAALDILHRELRAKGAEVFYHQPQTTLSHQQASDWLVMPGPVTVDKTVRESGDTDRLQRKFERKLSELVDRATPPELYDAMQDVIIESSRRLSEFFVSKNYKYLVKDALISGMQKRGNEILTEVDGAAETFFFAAQRLKKSKTLETTEPCSQVANQVNKKLEDVMRSRPMPRKLVATMKDHIKGASNFLSGHVTKPDDQIEAYIALLDEMEAAPTDAKLFEGNIPKTYKEAAAYLRQLTSFEDQINKPDAKLQTETEGKLKNLMSNVPPSGYSQSVMNNVIAEAATLLVSYIMLQGAKTEALELLVKEMDNTGDNVLLRHGPLRKSFKEGADLLRGKNTDQLGVHSADPVVSRKIQIKLNNLMENLTPAHFEKLMDDAIEDATLYLSVQFLEPQVLKVCKCNKNVFVQCELWVDEILRHTSRPSCTCSRHVSACILRDLVPTKQFSGTPASSSAFSPQYDSISLVPCPARQTPANRFEPHQDCPASQPTSSCPGGQTTSYLLYSTSTTNKFGFKSSRCMPSTSADSLLLTNPLHASGLNSPIQSLLKDIHSTNAKFEEQDQEQQYYNNLMMSPGPSTMRSYEFPERSPSFHTPLSSPISGTSRGTRSCDQFDLSPTCTFTTVDSPVDTITQAKTGFNCRTPIIMSDQMADWHAVMVSLIWNAQAWRDWIQENVDRALAFHYDPNVPRDEIGDNWSIYQRKVSTEALQWRQYCIFSRQLTTRLTMRYKDKEVLSPTNSTIKTKTYLECQEELMEIIEMFNRWTQWLSAVLKETNNLPEGIGCDVPLHEQRWLYLKKKVEEYAGDWTKYTMHLDVSWEHNYCTLMAEHLPLWKQPGPVWVVSTCGAVPSGAVAAGMNDSEVIWVARTTHKGSVLPAALYPSKHCCLVFADGTVHRYTKYQVMCNAEVRWVAWRGGSIGGRAVRVAAGVHVGRVHYRGNHLLGAVHEPHYRCQVVIFGRPFAFNCYELLMLADDE